MNTITFCVVDGIENSFICEVYGNFTIDLLKDIEQQFRDRTDIKIGPNTLLIKIKAEYFQERQYNNADCLTLNGWDFREIDRTEI